jgi:hypothetical protein
MKEARLWASAGAILCACSAKTIDVGPGVTGMAGSTSPGTGGQTNDGATVNAALPTWPGTDDCVASTNLPIVGTWNGSLEGMGQDPNWSSLQLVIRGASATGGVCGTMMIGTGILPPPATNPDVGYPMGVMIPPYSPPIISGFTFTLLNGTVDNTGRVRFAIPIGQPWRGWCGLQTPHATATGYSCVPDTMGGGFGQTDCFLYGQNGEPIAFDCGKMALCDEVFVCACNGSRCDADPAGHDVYFDMHFDSAEANGTGNDTRAFFSRSE